MVHLISPDKLYTVIFVDAYYPAMYVSREMAMDACMPEIEGQLLYSEAELTFNIIRVWGHTLIENDHNLEIAEIFEHDPQQDGNIPIFEYGR